MRPAIGFCIPRRCLLRCNLLVKAAPLRPACFPSLQPPTARRQLQHLYATPENDQNIDEDDESEGLLPEEDWTVPGGYQDSLSSNTELGRAVQNACDELDNLSSLEKESLTKADELLQKLGYKGSILQDTSSSVQKEQDKKE